MDALGDLFAAVERIRSRDFGHVAAVGAQARSAIGPFPTWEPSRRYVICVTRLGS